MNEQAGHGKWVVFTTCLAILAVSIVTLLMMSNSRARNLASHAQLLQKQSEAGPLVEIATAEAGPDHEDITLLGEAIPYNSATLYAQVSGYLKSIQVDKGDHVRAGQHLAEIISPKVDYQYQAALANWKMPGRRWTARCIWCRSMPPPSRPWTMPARRRGWRRRRSSSCGC